MPLRLSRARHREILGILITAQGRAVSTGGLVEDLWEDPPDGAVGAVRTFVGEIRKVLEPQRPPRVPSEILVTEGDGYALRPVPAAVDLWRAEQAIRAADGRSPEVSEPLLSAALDEWRGTAFEEFRRQPWAKSERARVERLRAGAVEQLAEIRLTLGRPHDVVALLEAQIEEFPWREEGWRLLALALYRSARPGEALDIIARARTTLIGSPGADPRERLTELERGILRQDPALEVQDGGSILMRTAAVQARTSQRTQLESATALLPLLAVSGAVEVAAEQRTAVIAAAEHVGDPEVAARVIGGFDVPGSWTRSDDPARSTAIVEVALRTLTALPLGASDRLRARLLATIAMESRGTANRLAEAAEAERIARRLGDAALLCFALSSRYLQSFETAGQAGTRDMLGAEIVAAAVGAELPTFEIEGRLIRMQALCALDDVAAASRQADLIDALAERFDRPLASVFTAWFRWSFMGRPPPPEGTEMPGFRDGLSGLAELTRAVRTGTELPDSRFGPYEPWARPLLLARQGRREEAAAALDAVPDPPDDLMLEVAWFLTGLAAVESGHDLAARRAYDALLPAAGERAGGSGAIDLGPIAPLLDRLRAAAFDGRS
ncbi:BTAD domain-containing putative transcriptional regulator [Citricoccus sp. K5]|uniref:AfsR/SARP family transcriptional regulator n=1 Tax=Citricoccus sp. K5 TaxID=2653135 RepID=UPI0021105EDA|nr:BTAD domain-containing putative transcriptional regulator [Citricoccus sp. K5]